MRVEGAVDFRKEVPVVVVVDRENDLGRFV